MIIALDLLARELALVLVLGALGSGLTSFLPSEVPGVARIALAPVFGLALAAAVLASITEVMTTRTAGWAVLVPLTVASAAVFVWRTRAAKFPRERARNLAFPIAVTVVVLGGLNAPLVANSSMGPMTYSVGDASIYVGFQALLKDRTLAESDISEDLSPREIFGDLIETYAEELPRKESRETLDDLTKVTNLVPMGATTTASATSSLFGWRSVDSQTAFLAAFVLIGALAAFGFCHWLTGNPWASSAAALLLAGPVTYQIYVDSSEAALAAIALIPLLGFLSALLLRRGAWTCAILLGIALAGFQATYPLWLPAIGSWAVLVVVVAAIKARRDGRLSGATLRAAAARLAVIAAIAVALSPVAFARGVTFIHLTATSELLEHLAVVSLPTYDLAFEVIPGWLFGMREFYGLPRPENAGFDWIFTGALAPALVLAVVVLGAWYFRRAWILVALIPVAALLAYQAWFTVECSYCVQRNLLPLAPVIAILFGLGLVGLARLSSRLPVSAGILRGAAVAIGVVVIAVAAVRDSQLARRAVAGGYMMNADAREVSQDRVAALSGVHLEGPEATGNPLVEANALYQSVEEATGSYPSVAPTSVYISVFGGRPHSSVRYDPNHRYVITRFAGVDSGRRTLYRAGPYALQETNRPYDVTIEGGVLADLARNDPSGQAWVMGPLELFVTSDAPGPAWVQLLVEGEAVDAIAGGDDYEIAQRNMDQARICVRVSRSGINGKTTVDLGVEPVFGAPGDPMGNVGTPDSGVVLKSVRASGEPCDGGRSGGG